MYPSEPHSSKKIDSKTRRGPYDIRTLPVTPWNVGTAWISWTPWPNGRSGGMKTLFSRSPPKWKYYYSYKFSRTFNNTSKMLYLFSRIFAQIGALHKNARKFVFLGCVIARITNNSFLHTQSVLPTPFHFTRGICGRENLGGKVNIPIFLWGTQPPRTLCILLYS